MGEPQGGVSSLVEPDRAEDDHTGWGETNQRKHQAERLRGIKMGSSWEKEKGKNREPAGS